MQKRQSKINFLLLLFIILFLIRFEKNNKQFGHFINHIVFIALGFVMLFLAYKLLPKFFKKAKKPPEEKPKEE